MKQFWDERYQQGEYAYGIEPNDFLKACLEDRIPGRLLLPAEGEGRNAVFASKLGWEVESFDSSKEGRRKAMKLASQHDTSFDYHLADYASFQPVLKSFELVALIYTHSGSKERRAFHKKLTEWLAPKGEIVLEGFSKNQLGRDSGGPKNADMLWSLEELKEDFAGLTITYASEEQITLNEGAYHQGNASVIRMIAFNSPCLDCTCLIF